MRLLADPRRKPGPRQTWQLARFAALVAIMSSGCDQSPVVRPATVRPAASEQTPAEHAADDDAAALPAPVVERPDEPAADLAADWPRTRLLLYPPSGPVLLEVALAIQRMPQTAAFDGLLDLIAAAADQDRNGVLTWDEAADSDLILSPLSESDNPATMLTGESLQERFDQNGNGRLERRELARMLVGEQRSSQPFSVVAARGLGLGKSADPALFQLLDTNHDGGLDPAELQSSGRRLASRDFDADGYVARADLSANPSSPGMPVSSAPGDWTNYGPPILDWIRSQPAWNTIYYTLTEWYSASDVLAVDDFPNATAWWKQFDVDGDRFVSITEITALDTAAPQVTLTIDFCNNESRLEGTATQSIWESRLEPPNDDSPTLTIHLQPIPILVSLVDGPQASEAPVYPPDAFDHLDSDADQRLSTATLESSGALRWKRIEDLDADGDGHVSTQELLKQIGRLSDYQVTLTASITTTDPWSMLDTNQDGRLHPREIARVAELLGALDTNHDQRVTHAELPRQLSLRFVRGLEKPTNGGTPATPEIAPQERAPRETVEDLPRWFRGTDANQDGEITRAEFLGTRAQFDALDANHDDVLTRSEALRAD